MALGDLEVRQVEVAERSVSSLISATGGCWRSPREAPEQRAPSRRPLQVELVGLDLQPVGRVEVGGLPMQSSTSCASDCSYDVVQVVGGDERQAELRRQAAQLLVEPALLRQAVVLDLEEEVVRAEDVAVVAGDAPASSQSSVSSARDLAVEAADRPIRPSRAAARNSRSMRGL